MSNILKIDDRGSNEGHFGLLLGVNMFRRGDMSVLLLFI